jgi:hypothetical protein
MKLRKEQMEAFSAAAMAEFEDRLFKRETKLFAEDCKKLGDERVRLEIRGGIERAATYGLTTELAICRFVDVMFAFGRDFDTNKKLPWAREILTDPAIESQLARAEKLFNSAKDNYSRAPKFSRRWKA